MVTKNLNQFFKNILDYKGTHNGLDKSLAEFLVRQAGTLEDLFYVIQASNAFFNKNSTKGR